MNTCLNLSIWKYICIYIIYLWNIEHVNSMNTNRFFIICLCYIFSSAEFCEWLCIDWVTQLMWNPGLWFRQAPLQFVKENDWKVLSKEAEFACLWKEERFFPRLSCSCRLSFYKSTGPQAVVPQCEKNCRTKENEKKWQPRLTFKSRGAVFVYIIGLRCGGKSGHLNHSYEPRSKHLKINLGRGWKWLCTCTKHCKKTRPPQKTIAFKCITFMMEHPGQSWLQRSQAFFTRSPGARFLIMT